MSVELTFRLFGDEVFRHRLQNISDRADNLSPAFAQIRDKWLEWFEEQFGTEGKRSGSPWEPLKFATIQKRGTAHPILFDTGQLFDDVLNVKNFHIDDDTIRYEGPDWGNRDDIAGFHQTGTSRMDARPIVDFTDMDEREMIDILDTHIFNPLSGRFRDARGRFAKRPS